ncbi:MAG TPA: UV damage endonuclease UvsE [Alphaproteobacteria bacterium]|nr:UV damage endonuclease UvsE [Alphaproteobacteria bacterium]
MNGIDSPRLGFCCKFIPPDGDKERTRRMNQLGTTVTALARLPRAAAVDKVLGLVDHNMQALEWQLRDIAARPPLEHLLRIASEILPAYTHPQTRWIYDEPAILERIERGLGAAGELARRFGIRLSMHPGQFCVMATDSPSALANTLDELEYHTQVMRWLGHAGGWHPHGAHINVHGGARGPGVAVFRANLAKLSADCRGLLTVENDEIAYGLDDLLPLADVLPIVLDLHHHWIKSGGEYIRPDDPRIARVAASWRGVRPLAHVSAPREGLVPDFDADSLPDFHALLAAGVKPRDLRGHSDMMWNRALNDLVAAHLAWADFEVEAKAKNLASAQLAAQVAARPAPGMA